MDWVKFIVMLFAELYEFLKEPPNLLLLTVGGLLGLYVKKVLAKERAKHELKIESLRNDFSVGLQTIKSELAKKHTVHKLQFEKEFEIYKELWAALVKLRGSAVITPSLDIMPTGKSAAEVYRERLAEAANNFDEVWKICSFNRPFYHRNIDDVTQRLLKDCRKHIRKMARKLRGNHLESIESEDYDEADKLLDKVKALTDQIEEAIQLRIGLLQEAELVE